MNKKMSRKLITYSLIGLLAGSFAIALSMYTKAQQPTRMLSDSGEMMHQPSSEEHDMNQMPGMESSSGASSHSQPAQAVSQAKLNIAEATAPNRVTSLTIEVQDKNGQPITNFETFQEKLMHLIVVSNDFQVFNHIHPDYQNDGRFTVQTTFPQSGNYTLFSDYKPVNQSETVSVLDVTVPGTPPATSAVNFDRNKTIDTTEATLTMPPTVQAGQEVTVTFNLKDAASNQAVTDLQPYLGEKGHLVILRQSSALTKADYIHAHALRDTPDGQVSFMTQFPQPGRYKLWGQFDRNGKIIVADFWVNVQ